MKNRTLPYGYQCCNGITVLHPQESEIVKRIFESYLNGQSLLTIATWLNEEQIEYMPGVIGWNKARLNLGVLQTLKVHIGMGLQSEQTEDNSMELQIRIAEIDAEFKAMLAKISTDTVDAFDEEKAKRLMDEKARLQQQLGNIRDGQLKREQTQSRLDDIYTILDGLKNRPMEYDEQIVRQLLECITVDSKEQITAIFVGGLKVVQPLID